MIRRLLRWIERRHQLSLVEDCDAVIKFHERQLERLPAAIEREKERRKAHIGRADTLKPDGGSRVNWNGMVRRAR